MVQSEKSRSGYLVLGALPNTAKIPVNGYGM
jgi:hypothetical protein